MHSDRERGKNIVCPSFSAFSRPLQKRLATVNLPQKSFLTIKNGTPLNNEQQKNDKRARMTIRVSG